MMVNVHCPNCSKPIELTVPVTNNQTPKRGEFRFTCPMCGVKAILEVQFSTNDKDFIDINIPPNTQNCKCQIQLPGGVNDKINMAVIKPEIEKVDGQPIIWISHKLGFTRPEKKSLVS